MSGPQIVEIRPKHKYDHPPVKYPSIPQHEFCILVVAAPGSGKTNLICNFCANHYAGYFHKIYVCSPTVENDPKWDVIKSKKGILVENVALKRALGDETHVGKKKVPKIVHASIGYLNRYLQKAREETGEKFDGKIPPEDFFESLDEVRPRLAENEKIIKRLKELHYGDKSKYMANRILVIEDDQAGLYKGGSTKNLQTNTVFKRRHYCASIIKVVQQYKSLPAAQRTAISALILFEISNIAELQKIYEEWSMGLTWPQWLSVYHYCTKEPFSFLYYNSHFPHGQRIYKNFDERITVKTSDSHPDADPQMVPEQAPKAESSKKSARP